MTKELKDKMEILVDGKSWLGDVPKEGERLDGQDHLAHYHGDFKRSLHMH